MFIEALADGGVACGLPRKDAYILAAQMAAGSARMVLQGAGSGSAGSTPGFMHPGVLKDAVCSPGGTTIEAVEELERKGFRAAIMDAMKACADRSREMSGK